MTKEMLFLTLDGIYNNIYVVDRNMSCIYANYRCTINYGLLPEQMIGVPHSTLLTDSWYPSGYPYLQKYKRTISIEHVTKTGNKNTCISTPVLNDKQEIDMYISVNQEKRNLYDGAYFVDSKELQLQAPKSKMPQQKDMSSNSPNFLRLLDIAEKVANNDIPILLQGETGTGKTKLAHHIHTISKRKNSPFFSLNCSSIPTNLLESELFGYEGYAFTGADKNGKKGLLEQADGGTLFLDEIGDMDISIQAKLLHAIENKSFLPVGGKKHKTVDVRILSATNRNLQELMQEKRFREDLYWRIGVVNLYLPPLRERKEDIPQLAHLFLQECNLEYELQKTFAPAVIDFFTKHTWPGNIRQLKNIVERTMFLSMEDTIHLSDVPDELCSEPLTQETTNYHELIVSWEKEIVYQAYLEYKTIRKIAFHLQISTSMAQRLVQKYIHQN